MAQYRPLSTVIRISEVVLTKEALEAALQAKLDRYGPDKSGSKNYAQLDIGSGGWDNVIDYVNTIGPKLCALRKDQLIGVVTIDVAVAFRDNAAAISVNMPSHAAEAISRFGMDIEFSIYSTSE